MGGTAKGARGGRKGTKAGKGQAGKTPRGVATANRNAANAMKRAGLRPTNLTATGRVRRRQG